MNTQIKTTAICILLLASGSSLAGTIKMALESPAAANTYQGITNIRGWAISTSGIDRVELHIDGVLKTNIPSGGSRNDVGKANPGYPEASSSGYSMAYNYNLLSPGQHSILVRAYDKSGAHMDKTASINVIGFGSNINDVAQFDLSDANVSAQDNRLTINGLTIGSTVYDAQLTWRAETQRYEFTEISPR